MNRLNGKDRAEILASYVVDTGATVRQTAKRYGVSKSTVHKDLTYKLKVLNPKLYKEVKAILEVNKQERHLRGGEATKRKFMLVRMSKIKKLYDQKQ